MKSAGAWVFSARLHADTATVVRSSGGEVVTTDGPFVEAKEHLGGFYIIEAADLDERPRLGIARSPMRSHRRSRSGRSWTPPAADPCRSSVTR